MSRLFTLSALSTRRRLAIFTIAACLVLGVGGVALAMGGPSTVQHGSPPVTSSPELPSALLVSATNRPLRVPGSDGLQHLEYDLIITNVFTAPVTLTSVEIRSGSGRSLLRLTGNDLATVTEGLLLQTPVKPPAQVPVSGSVAVVIDVAVPADEVPAGLTNVIDYSVPADAPALALLGDTTGEITTPTLSVDPRQPLLIAPPLRGNGWFSLQGCCRVGLPGLPPNGHRSLRYALAGNRIVLAETFAIDWVQLRGGRYFEGDGNRLDQYPYLGSDVLAVANGRVVFTRDDMPDETPNQPPVHVKKPIDFAGNQVVLRLGRKRYAVYAHLEPGSVAVHVGQRVRTGQVLAKLGNSGNSTAPHLHFVITDRPQFISATSLPFVIDRYTLQGNVTPENLVAALTAGQPIPVNGPPQAQSRTHPLVLSVSDFR
jgi:murein DD-endopeptidase MepM/ murein hydrolase activator NlpD